MTSLSVLFENSDLLIVSKPSGVDVYKVPELLGCLQNKQAPTGSGQFFLVHRIDKETSGGLVVAKTLEMKKYLEDLFREGKVEKEYVTLVKGLVKQQNGEISFRLEGREKGMKVNALTRFRVVKRFPQDGVTLLSVQILTGRMHQIRKHMSMIRHPVVMDPLHGDFSWNKIFRKAFGLKRLFLHAKKIRFRLPNASTVDVTVPLSEDLQKTLSLLR